MRVSQLILALGIAAGLAACETSDTVSRAVPDDAAVEGPAFLDWTVREVRVDVPGDLVVPEENIYYPVADIVWRGDVEGDRREQVRRILETDVQAGIRHLDGPRPVYMDIELFGFHSLTRRRGSGQVAVYTPYATG